MEFNSNQNKKRVLSKDVPGSNTSNKAQPDFLWMSRISYSWMCVPERVGKAVEILSKTIESKQNVAREGAQMRQQRQLKQIGLGIGVEC